MLVDVITMYVAFSHCLLYNLISISSRIIRVSRVAYHSRLYIYVAALIMISLGYSGLSRINIVVRVETQVMVC